MSLNDFFPIVSVLLSLYEPLKDFKKKMNKDEHLKRLFREIEHEYQFMHEFRKFTDRQTKYLKKHDDMPEHTRTITLEIIYSASIGYMKMLAIIKSNVITNAHKYLDTADEFIALKQALRITDGAIEKLILQKQQLTLPDEKDVPHDQIRLYRLIKEYDELLEVAKKTGGDYNFL